MAFELADWAVCLASFAKVVACLESDVFKPSSTKVGAAIIEVENKPDNTIAVNEKVMHSDLFWANSDTTDCFLECFCTTLQILFIFFDL